MKHIEELPLESFYDLVNNPHLWRATVKIDGTCAINFGFDDVGRLYTAFGRDFKNAPVEQRKYSTQDWMKRNIIMNNPGALAHAVLDTHSFILRPLLPNNEPVVMEVVLLTQPNCVRYKSDENLLILLNHPELAKPLDIHGKITIPQVTIWGLETMVEKQSCLFKIITPPVIDTAIFDIKAEVGQLNAYLKKSTLGISNHQIASTRVTNKNREIVLKIRGEIEVLKLRIKDKLVKALDGYALGLKPLPGYEHEGFVIQYGNLFTKVVNKSAFTARHCINWKPAHDAKDLRLKVLKEDYPKRLAMSLLMRWCEEFKERYPQVSEDMVEFMKDQLRMAYIDLRRSNK